MTTINEAKRLIKRAALANIASDKRDLAITPLISGQHGIGKSQMIKSIAEELGGICITIEGGTLKEGEITGLPYQYQDADGSVGFSFLPYYAVERIQREEKRIFEESEAAMRSSEIAGRDNQYALNDLTPQEKIEAIRSGRIRLVVVFIDEINRTENAVYKELMNILLTRSVNGYEFPWWVLFVGAMNPSTQNSIYATNEMDPAQLDRFIKIKVSSSSREWLSYAKKAGISKDILDFIKENPKCLSTQSRELDDEDKPEPSPRGWDMVDTILATEPMLRSFFTDKENDPKTVEKDMKSLVSAKLGATVATMFFASRVSAVQPIEPERIFADDENLSACTPMISELPVAKRVQTSDLMISYLKSNIEFMALDQTKFTVALKQLSKMVEAFDPATRLLFAQNVSSAITDDGNSLMELLFDVFESELIEMLDLADAARYSIEKS